MAEVRLSIPDDLKEEIENFGKRIFGEKGKIKKTIIMAIEEFLKKRKRAKDFLKEIEELNISVGGSRREVIEVKKIWEK